MARLSWKVFPASPIGQFLGREWDQVFGKLIDSATVPETSRLQADVWETGEKVGLETDLPGVDPENLDLQVTREGLVEICVKPKDSNPQDGSTWIRRERVAFAGARAIQLPFRVDPDKVEASLKNGVLTLTLVKLVENGPRKVQVKTS